MPIGIADRARNAAQDLTGEAEDAIGGATDNERLEAEDKADRADARAEMTGENVKDALS